MKFRAQSAGWLALSCAVALVGACQLPGAPVAGPGRDHQVSANAFGNVVINVNGRSFRLRTDDDKPVSQLSVMAAGKQYSLKDGALQLPAGALNHAKQYGKGFFTVLAQGYSPKQVWIGQVGDDIVLNHLKTITIFPQMSLAGGTLKAPDRSVTVTIPPGMIAKEGTNVALSSYEPAITPEDESAFLEERNSFIDKLKQRQASGVIATGGGNVIAAGGGNYRVAAKGCDPADGLPCELDEALGFLVTADGPLKPGKMSVLIDMAALLEAIDREGGYAVMNHKLRQKGHGSKRSRAARQVLDVIHDMDAIYGPGWRQVLYEDYGVEVLGSTYMSFPVTIGEDAVENGTAVSVVKGFGLFGVKVEATVVSTVSGALPAAAALADMIALTPAAFINSGGNLISNNSSSLISNNIGNLIANNGGGLISNNGSGVVSNNGGTLIGSVRVPFLPESAKYRAGFGLLAGLQEFDWPSGARVRAVDETGKALTDWAELDERGQYRLDRVPAVGGLVFLECEASAYKLRTLAPQPAVSRISTADINTTTTSVTSLVRDRLTTGRYGVEDVSANAGFKVDNDLVRTSISLDQARTIVETDLKAAAAITEQLLPQPASIAPPTFQRMTMKVLEMPDHAKAPKGLAAVTGLPASAFAVGRTTDVTSGFAFDMGQLTIQTRGYGDALYEPPSYLQPEFDPVKGRWFFPGVQQFWRVAAATEGSDAPGPDEPATPEPTPKPTPTPPPALLLPPDLPEGPVNLLYTVQVRRGSGEIAKYQFLLSVSNYAFLQYGGMPLPLSANMLEPRRVPGALLGNYWAYVGTEE